MSVNKDPSTWRLTTLGGIPTKILARTGSFSDEDSSLTETYIIQASQLLNFVTESFPSPVVFNGIVQYPIRRKCPGLPTLSTMRISWEGLSGDAKPCDPFSVDPSAPSGTYEQFLKVTVEYGTSPGNDISMPDSGDPRTFLEINANATGEFITTPPSGKAVWDPATKRPGDPGDDTLRERQIPQVVPTSEVEWSVRWSQIPSSFYTDSLAATLRSKLGHVNNGTMSLLLDAPEDTILFAAYSASQQFTWRSGFVGKPPIQLEMKFIEKNFIDTGGVQVTHQHYYRPGYGFRKLLVDGTNPSYPQADLDAIFKPA